MCFFPTPVKVAAEETEAPHNKNWNNIPNCDSDFYVIWKRGYHGVMSIVNKDKRIREIGAQSSSSSTAKPVLVGVVILAFVGFAYKKFVRPAAPLT
jgi:hypothetical protein